MMTEIAEQDGPPIQKKESRAATAPPTTSEAKASRPESEATGNG